MRRKYFIRGMGLGIIITTLVFIGVLFFKNDELKDSEIIDRALALGLVMPESGTIAEDKDKSDDAGTKDSSNIEVTQTEEGTVTVETLHGDDVTPPPNETSENTPAASDNTASHNVNDNAANSSTNTQSAANTTANATSNTTSNTKPSTPSTTPASTPQAATQANANGASQSAGNIKSFTIRSGEDSAAVGARLYQAGLVENAKAFDNYLESNGYDTSIRTGTFDIREGSSYETIAKIITGQ